MIVQEGSDEETEHVRAGSREDNELASPQAEQHQSSTIAQTQLHEIEIQSIGKYCTYQKEDHEFVSSCEASKTQ